MGPIEVRTIEDGAQPASAVAGWLAEFIGVARNSLSIAIYDFALANDTEATVAAALRDAIARGVRVRLAYNVGHGGDIPVPPPPATDAAAVAALGVEERAIPGAPHLMHHKYVVRDEEAVWTGSANWTEDSWTREENVVAFVSSPAVAAAYERDFEDLWSSGRVEESGAFTPDPDPASGMRVRFAPGRGRQISHRVAVVLAHARRIRIASPVITAGPILGTLAEIATAGSADIAGVFDATQMREVLHQWRSVARMWKVQALATVVRHAPFGGKVSTPFGPGTVHDYMHAKVVVADDTVFLGSYNLSHAGEDNAENVIEVRDGTLAARMADFIDGLRARYPAVPLPHD